MADIGDIGDSHRRSILLQPGEHRVATSPTMLSTLLGSCVAVCLYDRPGCILGMNHFLLPSRRHASGRPVGAETEAGRYGNEAMQMLIHAMLTRGARRDRLCAKAFGGAKVLGHPCADEGNLMCVGKENLRFVQVFLADAGIPLVAADLGGGFGRLIYFSGTDFSVHVRKIENPQSLHPSESERLCWRQAAEQILDGQQPTQPC